MFFLPQDKVRVVKILTLEGKVSVHKVGYSIFGILKSDVRTGSKIRIWNGTIGKDLETSPITKTTGTEDGRLFVETEEDLFLVEEYTPSFKR
jgi:hypothetical protein